MHTETIIMKKHLYRTPLAVYMIFWLFLVAIVGCQDKSVITSWHSPRLIEAKKEWDSLLEIGIRATGPEAIEKYGEKNEKLIEMLLDIIKKQLSEDDMRRLVASCEELPALEKNRSDFCKAVLGYLAAYYIDAGDREMLVELLAKRCPSRVSDYNTVETWLVFRGNKLKDPILILGEAYFKCQTPEVRHTLAAAIRRSFTDLGVRGKDDAEFVKNAMQWYEKEKDHLVYNRLYRLNDESFPVESYERYPDLYEKKVVGRELLFLRTCFEIA
jgi:hypothetical protein